MTSEYISTLFIFWLLGYGVACFLSFYKKIMYKSIR